MTTSSVMTSRASIPCVLAYSLGLPVGVAEQAAQPAHRLVLGARQAAEQVGLGDDAEQPALGSVTGAADMPRSASSRARDVAGVAGGTVTTSVVIRSRARSRSAAMAASWSGLLART